MNCVLCKNGVCIKGTTTVTLTRGESIVVFKHVSAFVCDQCGHYYLDQATTRDILERANKAIDKGAELEVINLKAA